MKLLQYFPEKRYNAFLYMLMVAMLSCYSPPTCKGQNTKSMTTDNKHDQSDRSIINDGSETSLIAQLEAVFDTKFYPFMLLEKAPIHPDCVSRTQIQLKKCFSNSVDAFFHNDLFLSVLSEEGHTGLFTFNVHLIFNKDGNLLHLQTNASAEINSAAQFIFNEFPTLVPAKHKGKEVGFILRKGIEVEISK